jgi:hypothetical protein
VVLNPIILSGADITGATLRRGRCAPAATSAGVPPSVVLPEDGRDFSAMATLRARGRASGRRGKRAG